MMQQLVLSEFHADDSARKIQLGHDEAAEAVARNGKPAVISCREIAQLRCRIRQSAAHPLQLTSRPLLHRNHLPRVRRGVCEVHRVCGAGRSPDPLP